MGGHKHLHLPDGTDVHLIIHELRTGRVWGTADSTAEEDRYQEDCQRKGLLEQSDAVMLVFNPWSKSSYDWINGKIIRDILYTGRKKLLTSDIVRLLDGLAAAMPKRTGSNRSASDRSALSLNSLMKKLPRRPDEPDTDIDSGVSLFSEDDEKGSEDRIDYRGELKRISIVVEGSALKKAEFMIHEKDLPSTPPPQSPMSSRPTVVTPTTRSSRVLPTIREVDESSRRQQQRVAVMMDRRHLPIMKHDSVVSLQSTLSRSSRSSTSSTYSDLTATAIGTNHASELSDNTHPMYRESTTVSETILDETTERPGYQRWSTRAPTEETELPVLVVATMTDRLRDKGGNLDRHITPQQGQRLARKFGPNCAYIETSAKTNANVDEAYGIIVDQVMAKRAASRRDDVARARIEAAIAVVQADPATATRAMRQRNMRSCMPQWSWLNGMLAQVPSWETVSRKVSQVFGTAGDGEESGDESAAEIAEDVWGEEVVKHPSKAHHSERHSKKMSMMSEPKGLSEKMTTDVLSGTGNGPIFPDPARHMSVDPLIEEKAIQGTLEVGPSETTHRASQMMVVMPDRSDLTHNPFAKDEFKRPMNMVTVTTLEPLETTMDSKQSRRGADIRELLKHKTLLKGLRAQSTTFEGGMDQIQESINTLTAVSKQGLKLGDTATVREKAYAITDLHQIPDLFRREPKRSTQHDPARNPVGEQAPSIPPLTFDAIIIDDKRASVSVLVRPSDQARNDETIEHFLAQDATRDSMVMMLSPTTATRTLSAFVKEINSTRASEVMKSVVPQTRARESRRASEGVPEVSPLPGAESEIERRVKRVTSPNVPSFQLDVSDDARDEFITVLAPGVADAAMVKEPFPTAAVEEPSLATVAPSSAAPISVDKVLPTTPPTPPPSLKTGPPQPRKKSPPPPSPPAKADEKLPIIPEALQLMPKAVVLTASIEKDSLTAPIMRTTEVRGSSSSSSEDEWPKRPERARVPPNPRRARIRARGIKATAMAPPARKPQSPAGRPLSAWI